MTDEGMFLMLGQAWDQSYLSLPTDRPSFGWHAGYTLIIGDPFGEIDVDAWVKDTPRIGFAQHGPLAIVMMKSRAVPWLMESPRPYLVDDEPPEVAVEPGDHILWKTVMVSRGVIVNMRAFTTNSRVTVYLRRVMAEQRAVGPLRMAEADLAIMGWQSVAQTPDQAWRRCVVTCKAGD